MSELKQSLPSIVMEILEDKLDNDYIDYIANMILKNAGGTSLSNNSVPPPNNAQSPTDFSVGGATALSSLSPVCGHLFVVGGLRASVTRIAMLAGVFILLLGPPKPDRLKDRGQTGLSLFFIPLLSYSPLVFLLFPCFTRPYITYLR